MSSKPCWKIHVGKMEQGDFDVHIRNTLKAYHSAVFARLRECDVADTRLEFTVLIRPPSLVEEIVGVSLFLFFGRILVTFTNTLSHLTCRQGYR